MIVCWNPRLTELTPAAPASEVSSATCRAKLDILAELVTKPAIRAPAAKFAPAWLTALAFRPLRTVCVVGCAPAVDELDDPLKTKVTTAETAPPAVDVELAPCIGTVCGVETVVFAELVPLDDPSPTGFVEDTTALAELEAILPSRLVFIPTVGVRFDALDVAAEVLAGTKTATFTVPTLVLVEEEFWRDMYDVAVTEPLADEVATLCDSDTKVDAARLRLAALLELLPIKMFALV